MQRSPMGHPLNRLDVFSCASQAQGETRKHGLSVDDNGTRAALAELTAVFGAGKSEVFAENFE